MLLIRRLPRLADELEDDRPARLLETDPPPLAQFAQGPGHVGRGPEEEPPVRGLQDGTAFEALGAGGRRGGGRRSPGRPPGDGSAASGSP